MVLKIWAYIMLNDSIKNMSFLKNYSKILNSLSSEDKSIDFDNKEYDEVDKNENQIKVLLENMKSIDVNNISPIESLILLKQLKDDASEIN